MRKIDDNESMRRPSKFVKYDSQANQMKSDKNQQPPKSTKEILEAMSEE